TDRTDIGFPWTLTGSGSVSVTAGVLNIDNGGSSSGPMSAGIGAKLNFGGGTFTATGGVSGAGTIGFSNGTTNLNGAAGSYAVSGLTLINGGTANFNSTATTGTLELDGGVLGGSDTLTVSGLTTWTGGTMNGSGQTKIGRASCRESGWSWARRSDLQTQNMRANTRDTGTRGKSKGGGGSRNVNGG